MAKGYALNCTNITNSWIMPIQFSIITVTYNASAVIDATMKSLSEQTFKDFEHIVVDGASADDTVERVRSYSLPRTTIVCEPDDGLYDAMNKGIRLAKGEYMIFLNAGDTFYDADSLHVIADTAKRTHADVVYGQTKMVDAQGRIVGERHLMAPQHLTFGSFSRGMLVCHQAFVARRRIVHEYDTRYRFSADYEWCLRCLKQSKRNAYTGGYIIRFLEGGMTTSNHGKSLMERYRIMCRYYGPVTATLLQLTFVPRMVLRSLGLRR